MFLDPACFLLKIPKMVLCLPGRWNPQALDASEPGSYHPQLCGLQRETSRFQKVQSFKELKLEGSVGAGEDSGGEAHGCQ